MKIAFDLRPLQIGHQNRGIGAYILNLLHHIPKDGDTTFIFLRYNTSNPVIKYGIAEGRNYIDVPIKKHSFSKHPTKLFVYVISNLIPVFSKVMRHRPDVFFQCDYLLGAPRSRRCKVITVCYDLIPLKFRAIYLPSWRKYIGYRQFRFRSRARLMLHAWFYDKKYKNGVRLLKRSSKVISISKNTTKDLVSMIRLSEQKIATIYPAASFRHSKQDNIVSNKVKDLVDSITTPYIAYVGATDRRRQVNELVYAFNLYNARKAPISLLLGGKEFTKANKSIHPLAKHALETSSYKSNIHLLGYITEAEKRYVLEHAAVFVYPTIYEGFGLPILEAMEAGCPVITYKNSSIPEIAGDAVLYVDNYGGYSIYLTLSKLLADENLSKKISRLGRLRAKDFNWPKSVDLVWSEVIKLTRRKP